MSRAPRRILVVIPVYNNAGTLGGLVRDVRGLGLPVLLVNDGSTDGSGRIIEGSGFPHIDFPRNKGKGRAIRSALAWADEKGFSHIITIDADGQHEAADIPKFVARIDEAPDKIVIGRRAFAEGVPGRSRFGRWWSNLWIRAASGARTTDSQSGFRAYPVAAFVGIRFLGSRYEFEVEALVRAVWAGLGLDSVDVSVRYFPPEQRVSHFRGFRDNARISLMYAGLVARRLVPVPRRRTVRPDARNAAVPGYGNRAGFTIFRWTIRLFGLGPAYAVLAPVIAYYVLFRPSASRAAAPYLKRRFPGRGPLSRKWLTYRHYFSFGQCLIDQAAVQILGTRGLTVDFPESAQLKALVEEGRGLVLVTSHVGVWQSAISTLGYLGRPVYLHVRLDSPSREMGLADIEHCGLDLRVVSPDGFLGGVPELSLALARGNIVAVMGDRGFESSARQTVDFLGDRASFPTLPYHLAYSTMSDLVIFLTSRTGPRRFEIRADIQRLTGELAGLEKPRACARLLDGYVRALERHLQRHPLTWYNFFDPWAASGTAESDPDRK